MVRVSRTARWWAKSLTVVVLFFVGFFTLWFGAVSVAFAISGWLKLLGLASIMASIALFLAGTWIISGRRRYRHLPPDV